MARQPLRDRDRGAGADVLLEANARATRALVSVAMATGLAACGLSILSAVAIDALVDRGMTPFFAKLLVAAALAIPALLLANRAAAQLQRGSVLPMEALRRILEEAGQPTGCSGPVGAVARGEEGSVSGPSETDGRP